MRGSFYNSARAVDVIIESSQAEWKRGYEMGKKKGASLSDQKLLSRNYSAQFRDGHRRGRNELLGIPQESLKLALRSNLSPEEIAKEQYDRGRHVAEYGDYVDDLVLVKCHPSFQKGYRDREIEMDQQNDDDWIDELNREGERRRYW